MAGLFCFLRRHFKIYFFLLQSDRGLLVPVKSKRNATTQAACTDTGQRGVHAVNKLAYTLFININLCEITIYVLSR